MSKNTPKQELRAVLPLRMIQFEEKKWRTPLFLGNIYFKPLITITTKKQSSFHVSVVENDFLCPHRLKTDYQHGKFFQHIIYQNNKNTIFRLKKINCMSQSCRACVCFSVHVWFSKIQAFIYLFIFCLLNFFSSVFYELACQNIDEKTWQAQSNTLNNRLLQLCVLSCILFIQKSSSTFHTEQSCDQLKFKTSAAQKKKMAFRSGFPICHKLWDIDFFFFSRIWILYQFLLHIWMHNASEAYRKHASGAVCIQIMLLEHIWLRIFGGHL